MIQKTKKKIDLNLTISVFTWKRSDLNTPNQKSEIEWRINKTQLFTTYKKQILNYETDTLPTALRRQTKKKKQILNIKIQKGC